VDFSAKDVNPMSFEKKRKPLLGEEWFIISKKTIYKAIGSVIALVLLVVIGFVIKTSFENRKALDLTTSKSSRFLKIEGKVTIKKASNGTTIPASPYVELEPGDSVQTGSGATALIEYEDGSRYTVKSDSTIILKENSKQVVSRLEDGGVKVSTLDNSRRHIVGVPSGERTEFASGSDVGIDTRAGKTTIVVGRGLPTVFTSQGQQNLQANQRLDISKEGVKLTDLPPPPKLQTPENAKQLLISPQEIVTFSWQPVAVASGYRLAVSPNISFPEQSLTVNSSQLTEASYKWSKPISGNYFWRVQAINKEGYEGNWSEPVNFSVLVRKEAGKDIPLKITKRTEISRLLIEIEGVTSPGVLLTINNIQVDIDEKGRFKHAVTFSNNVPERIITIEAQDPNGNTKKITEKL
jgi:hypothetical protein